MVINSFENTEVVSKCLKWKSVFHTFNNKTSSIPPSFPWGWEREGIKDIITHTFIQFWDGHPPPYAHRGLGLVQGSSHVESLWAPKTNTLPDTMAGKEGGGGADNDL